jgi:hypothetical protein
MQIPDDYNVEQKMQWLTWSGVDSWGAPMRIPGGGDWKTAPAVQMIGAVWAGNMVEVLERRSFIVRYNGVLDDVPMSRIRTFTRADFGKSYATDPHIVHNVLAVGGTDKPHYAKGKIYLPLIFKYASVWTFDRWLE